MLLWLCQLDKGNCFIFQLFATAVMIKKVCKGQHLDTASSELPADQVKEGKLCSDYRCQRFVQHCQQQNTSAICITKMKASTFNLLPCFLMFYSIISIG